MDDVHEALTTIRAALESREADGVQVLAALTTLRELRAEITSWEPTLVELARQAGVSWADLAPALGVTSRQAAERRYLRTRPSAGDAPTKEHRVTAERTKRAGDRAVTIWARDNSASLRSLAGEIGSLDGLDKPGREVADRVRQALGQDDAAALLEPLAAAHDHLHLDHAALADQITDIGIHTDRVRADVHDKRRVHDQ